MYVCLIIEFHLVLCSFVYSPPQSFFFKGQSKRLTFYSRTKLAIGVSLYTYLLQTPQDRMQNSSTLNMSLNGLGCSHKPLITNESQSGCMSWQCPRDITLQTHYVKIKHPGWLNLWMASNPLYGLTVSLTNRPNNWTMKPVNLFV